MNKNQKRKQSLYIHKELSSYQWAIIRRMSLHQLLDFYREDETIITFNDFFSNLKHSTVENMLRLIFRNDIDDSPEEKKIYLQIINILKGGVGFIQFLIKQPNFDRDLIFGFLDQPFLGQTALRIFGEIFINFARSCPNKLMSVIKDEKIQYLFTKNMKKSQIFKIVYTMIFCLNKKTSTDESDFICAVIYSLLFVIFQNQEGDSIFDDSYWGCTRMKSLEKETAEFKISDSAPDKSDGRFSTKQSQDSFNPKLRQHFSSQKLEEFTQKLLKNTSEFFQQNIEIVENICEMIEELSKNLSQIEKGNVQIMVDIIIDQMYISRIMIYLNLFRNSLMSISSNTAQKHKHSEIRMYLDELQTSVYHLLYNIVMIHQSFQNSLISNSSQRSIREINLNREEKISSLGEIVEKMGLNAQTDGFREQQHVIETRIKLKLSHIIKEIAMAIMSEWSETKHYSKIFEIRITQTSGLSIPSMKMSKLWLIKTMIQILEISQHGQSCKTIKQGINQSSQQILNFLKETIQINKWNNIIQNQFLKLFELFLSIQYPQFLHQLMHGSQNFSENILGIIVASFRNSHHYFLNTMNSCKQGDQHFLFQLGKFISGTFSQRNDLKAVMEKYPVWKEFIHQDLKSYEAVLSTQSVFHDDVYNQPQLIKSKSTHEELPIDEPLQTIQEIIQDLQINRKWRLSESPPKLSSRRRKQSFNSFQVIKQIDSLRNFQLNNKK